VRLACSHSKRFATNNFHIAWANPVAEGLVAGAISKRELYEFVTPGSIPVEVLPMRVRALLLSFATVSLATAIYGQDANAYDVPDLFQVRYAANLNKGDAYVNITNSGSDEPFDNICVNVYTFDPSEEMVSCCACLVTPNALVSLSVQGDLISNTLSPSTPTAVVIKLVATRPTDEVTCNPGSTGKVALGMRAWGTTLHALPGTPTTYGVTEGAFLPGGLSAAEADHLFSFCGFIQANGSGFGICKSCRAGGLGGAKQ